jgi:hypothetical protein
VVGGDDEGAFPGDLLRTVDGETEDETSKREHYGSEETIPARHIARKVPPDPLSLHF